MLHLFANRWSVNIGPSVSSWRNISFSDIPFRVPTNAGITYFEDHVYSCGSYFGLMDYTFTTTTALTSSPSGFRNAYVWRFDELSGNAKTMHTADLIDSSSGKTNESTSNISIYPNPSNGLYNITSTNNDPLESLVIFDLLGQQVANQTQINTNKTIVDLTDLPSGIYLIRIFKNNRWYNHKIIKN